MRPEKNLHFPGKWKPLSAFENAIKQGLIERDPIPFNRIMLETEETTVMSFPALRQAVRSRIQKYKNNKKSTNDQERAGEAGFTLIELLVVLVILVLLASLVAPRVIGYLGSSRTKTAKIQIESLSTSLDLFKLDTSRYPSESEGLAALVERPDTITNWNGPYLKNNQVPQDPWGNPYHYKYPGEEKAFDIYSLGADNKVGGSGEEQDVSN